MQKRWNELRDLHTWEEMTSLVNEETDLATEEQSDDDGPLAGFETGSASAYDEDVSEKMTDLFEE